MDYTILVPAPSLMRPVVKEEVANQPIVLHQQAQEKLLLCATVTTLWLFKESILVCHIYVRGIHLHGVSLNIRREIDLQRSYRNALCKVLHNSRFNKKIINIKLTAQM